MLHENKEIKEEFFETAIELYNKDEIKFDKGEINFNQDEIGFSNKTPKIEIILNKVGVEVKTGKAFRKKKRSILRNVSALIKPGEMVAIMGPSGSGKTTLLNAIAGRSFGTETVGDILINGKPKLKSLVENAGYCMQIDSLLSNLTVHETLTHQGNLRLPATYSKERKQQIIEGLIKQLGLSICKDFRVGGGEKIGISGGQRKRVSIAQELMTNPSVLILDEPTTGLDSTTAANLCSTLHDLSRKGKTIIATIHQPSASVFFQFDKVILLSHGNMIYYGSTKDVVHYFSDQGYPCPPLQNPSDFIMDLITPGYKVTLNGETMESQIIYDKLVDAYPKYAEKNKIEIFEADPSFSSENLKKDKEYAPPNEFMKFLTLSKRAFTQAIREPTCTYARLLQNLFFGIIMGILYYKMPVTDPKVRNRLGGLYFTVLQNILTNLITDLFTFPQEREIFLREESNSAYGVVSYYFSKIISELPFQIVIPLFYSPIVYFLFGLQHDAGKFFIFAFNMVLIMHTSIALAVAISSGMANFRYALLFTPIIYVPMNLLAGYLIKPADIPGYLAWFRFLSIFKHGYEINVINEFSGLTITCPSGATCVYKTGEQVIKDNTDPGSHIWRSFLLQLCLTVLFHLTAMIFLKLNSRKPKFTKKKKITAKSIN